MGQSYSLTYDVTSATGSKRRPIAKAKAKKPDTRSRRKAEEQILAKVNPTVKRILKNQFGVDLASMIRKDPRTLEPDVYPSLGVTARGAFSEIVDPPYDAARLQEVYERHWVVRTCVDKLVREAARQGWRFEPLFEVKCEGCGAEYETAPPNGACPTCNPGQEDAKRQARPGIKKQEEDAFTNDMPERRSKTSSALRHPDHTQLVEAKAFLERPNPKLTLLDIIKRFARDLLIFDDAYVSEVGTTVIERGTQGRPGESRPREWWPEDARHLSILADAKGRPGGRRFCPLEETLKEPGKEVRFYPEPTGSPCPTGDGGVLLEAAYLQRLGGGISAAFSPGEMLHTNLFAVGSRLFGTPKLWALQTQITAMALIDAFQREAYDKNKTPNNIFLLKGVAEEALSRLLKQFREMRKQDLAADFWIPVPNATGAHNSVGIERVPGLDLPILQDAMAFSEWYFKSICYTFGVDPASLGVETQGRLGGSQEKAMSRGVSLETIADLQKQISEAFDAFIKAKWPSITDFRWTLETAHEDEEAKDWEIKRAKMEVAKLASEAGFDVELDENGDPRISGAIDQEEIAAKKAEEMEARFGALSQGDAKRPPATKAIRKQDPNQTDHGQKIDHMARKYEHELGLVAESIFSSLRAEIRDVFGYAPSQTEKVTTDLSEGLIRRLERVLDSGLPEGEDKIRALATEAFIAGMTDAMEAVKKQGFGLDPADDDALEALEAQSVESMRNVLYFGDKESYLLTIKELTRAAAEEGWTTQRLATELERKLDPEKEHFSRSMWERIARTEPAIFVTRGRLAAYGRFGVPKVRWVAASDAVDICAARDGMTYTLEEAGEMLPAHPSCRCAWAPSWGD